MIDTHTHFNSEDLKNIRGEIKQINSLSYLDKLINVGLNYSTSKETIEISLVEPKFFAAIGIHPLHDGNAEQILALSNNYDCHKVVAIGEIGLDNRGDIQLQKEKFISQIELANFLQLPIIIHSNNTNNQVMDIIQQYPPKNGFVFHCFQPDLEIAKEIINLGGYISFATMITKPTAKKSLDVLATIPIENILIELDYPYLSQNTQVDGKNVFNKIRDIRGISFRELETQIDKNAKRLFKRL